MKINQVIEGLKDPKDNPCWKGYKPVGTKKKNGKTVPNCVPKESVAKEDSALDKRRDKLGSQGYIGTQDDRLRDLDRHNQGMQNRHDRNQEYQDAEHQSSLNRISNRDELDAARTKHEIDVLAHRLKRMDRDDDDWERTFDMMRDRINRYQYSTQRDVDPEQLAAISNIRYEPRKKKTDFKEGDYQLDKIRRELKPKVTANKKAWDALSPEEKEKAKQLGQLGRKSATEKDMKEMYGRRRSSYGYNPDRDAEREWDAARRADQDFRNRERNAGLEDEEEYYQQQVARQRELDRGPWYLKVNGKILKSKGEVKVFDWKSGAAKYGQAILKNRPELQGKIFLTKKNQDDSIAEAGELKVQKDDDKATVLLNPATGVQTQIDKTNPNAPRLTQDEQGKLKLSMAQGAQSGGAEQKPNLVGKDVAIDANPVEDVHQISASPSQPGGEITDVNPRSPISGDEDHDEISKLLNQRLRKLAGL